MNEQAPRSIDGKGRRQRRRGGRFIRNAAFAIALVGSISLDAGCSATKTVLPDINTVPSASQLPPASPKTVTDFDLASDATDKANEMSQDIGGNLSPVYQELGQISNSEIAKFAWDAAEEQIIGHELYDVGDGASSNPASILPIIADLQVKPVRRAAYVVAKDLLAVYAITQAGNSNISLQDRRNKSQGALRQIADPRTGVFSDSVAAQEGVTDALQNNTAGAIKILILFQKRELSDQDAIDKKGESDSQFLKNRARQAEEAATKEAFTTTV
jgi:hypothetical protein